MNADQFLFGPRLKVERANRHIDELRRLTRPLSRELHTVALETDLTPPYAKPSVYRLMYKPLKPIPETLALIVGDAIHNLRGALDHLATGIVRTAKPRAEVHFPMRKIREDLVTARDLVSIEQTLPGSSDLLLNEIRPKNAADEALWSFHVIDNDDKHNLIVPTVTITRITGLTLAAESNAIANGQIRFDASKPLFLVRSDVPLAVHDNFETTVEVTFGQAKVFENEPVIPTLAQISNLVSKTLDCFEDLIRSAFS